MEIHFLLVTIPITTFTNDHTPTRRLTMMMQYARLHQFKGNMPHSVFLNTLTTPFYISSDGFPHETPHISTQIFPTTRSDENAIINTCSSGLGLLHLKSNMAANRNCMETPSSLENLSRKWVGKSQLAHICGDVGGGGNISHENRRIFRYGPRRVNHTQTAAPKWQRSYRGGHFWFGAWPKSSSHGGGGGQKAAKP